MRSGDFFFFWKSFSHCNFIALVIYIGALLYWKYYELPISYFNALLNRSSRNQWNKILFSDHISFNKHHLIDFIKKNSSSIKFIYFTMIYICHFCFCFVTRELLGFSQTVFFPSEPKNIKLAFIIKYTPFSKLCLIVVKVKQKKIFSAYHGLLTYGHFFRSTWIFAFWKIFQIVWRGYSFWRWGWYRYPFLVQVGKLFWW